MRLTRRGVAVLLVGAVVAVVSSFMSSPAVRVLAAGLIAAPVFSLVWIARRRMRVEVRRQVVPAVVTCGESARVVTTLSIDGPRAFPSAVFEEPLPPALGGRRTIGVEGASAGATCELSYEVRADTRGRHRVEPLVLREFDAFGLATRSATIGEAWQLVVTPRIDELESFRVGPATGSVPFLSVRRERGIGEASTSIRTYEEGDDLRRLHWPSVARTGELMVRQEGSTAGTRALIVLDTRADALGRSGSAPFECAVSAAASIAVAFARSDRPFRIVAGGHQLHSPTLSGLRIELADVRESRGRDLDLGRVRSEGGEALVVVSSTRASERDLATLATIGPSASSRTAVLVDADDAHLSSSLTAAIARMHAAGWTVIITRPSEPLRWTPHLEPTPAAIV